MNVNDIKNNSIGATLKPNECPNAEVVLYFLLAAVMFLSYGYELFNFNLTIDEEIHANHIVDWKAWVAQGRWGMAILNYSIVQNPVTPVVSLFIGLFGMVMGIIFYLKKAFDINKVGIISITALSITTPTLPFTLTFSTLAYGVGFAFLCLSVSYVLITKKTVLAILFACVFAAFAISVYQTFVFGIAMLAIVFLTDDRDDLNSSVLVQLRYSIIYFFGSIIAYILINYIVLKLASLDVKYVGQFVDLEGFIHNPIENITTSFKRMINIFSLSPHLFGVHSIWLCIIVLASIVFALFYPLINRDIFSSFKIAGTLLMVIMVIVFSDSIAQGYAPLRSLVYIPIAVSIVVATAYSVCDKTGQLILITLSVLAVIGNSQVNNHLFASSASAEYKDRMLAESIINEVKNIMPDKYNKTTLKVEVIGRKVLPLSGIQSKTETFGASFFEWDGGNRYRVAAYLKLNGLKSVGASEVDRVRVYQQSEYLQSWPHQGWVTILDDILVLKFGDYSISQKNSLCAQGVTKLCL